MSEALSLPAKMDLSAAIQLVDDLQSVDGDFSIDASNVTNVGTLCLQALIAASREAKANGKSFKLISVPDRMAEQMKVMGASPEQLMEGTL